MPRRDDRGSCALDFSTLDVFLYRFSVRGLRFCLCVLGMCLFCFLDAFLDAAFAIRLRHFLLLLLLFTHV